MKVRLGLALLFACLPQAASAASPGQVLVRLSGFRNDHGKAYVALWRTAERFPGTPPAGSPTRMVAVEHHAAEARFDDVAPGSFAITVFHDEDGDGELKEGFFGIPKEGIGFSRNVRPRFRAPRYREAELQLEPGEREVVAIQIQYF